MAHSHSAAVGSATKGVAVVRLAETLGGNSVQDQILFPCITNAVCGTRGLSAGAVRMPPSKVSRVHRHHSAELIVVCIRGNAATLVGEDLDVVEHGEGDFVFIPEGVPHVAVNLSETEPVLAFESRTDPAFNDDVILMPELQERAEQKARQLRAAFALRQREAQAG